MPRNKKTKRPNLPQETLERARAELRGEVLVETPNGESEETPVVRSVSKPKTTVSAAPPQAAPKPKRTGVSARRIPTLEDLLTEYRYVLDNLRSLAILAVSLFVVVIVVSFILAHI